MMHWITLVSPMLLMMSFENIQRSSGGSWNSATISDAVSLLRSVIVSEFLMVYAVMHKVMAVVRGLSVTVPFRHNVTYAIIGSLHFCLRQQG